METEKEPTEHNAFVEVSQEDLPSTAEASPQIHSCARLWDWNQKPPSEFSVHSDVEKTKLVVRADMLWVKERNGKKYVITWPEIVEYHKSWWISVSRPIQYL